MPKKKIEQKITILFASDSNYAPHLATAIYSLLLHNKEIVMQLVVFTSDMTKKKTIKLKKSC